MESDVHVFLYQFHNGKIREFVTENDDGSYTIFVEETLSRHEQFEAYKHALKHIRNDDFHADSADRAEYSAHFYQK